ncbi:DUF763 domain-containing protein [Patescibacteria group bacterium]|nr:DUF763 domain-containing protein [Patescibacteria group bacterium]
MRRGVATFTLDTGKCPPWLFQRMVKLGREIMQVLVAEYGSDEFIRRISDPVWFQSLGTVLAFDWNASGLTTILTAALKEAIRGIESELGIFICGGKGKTSLKTPEQINSWGWHLHLPDKDVHNLIYNSRMSAKVDTALIQDGFELYHHAFFFSKNGAWAVVQQGMNKTLKSARRYHWSSDNATDLIVEPHRGIMSDSFQKKLSLNMTAKESDKNRTLTTEIVNDGNYYSLMKDIQILRKHSSSLSKMISVKVDDNQITLLELAPHEFRTHPILVENFSKSKYLDRILWQVCDEKPKSYEKLLSMKGIGPKTIRALSLVSEVIYGAEASYKDPARYSFAHGGKDATPYPVDRKTYDQSIQILKHAVEKSHIQLSDKTKAIQRLELKFMT